MRGGKADMKIVVFLRAHAGHSRVKQKLTSALVTADCVEAMRGEGDRSRGIQ